MIIITVNIIKIIIFSNNIVLLTNYNLNNPLLYVVNTIICVTYQLKIPPRKYDILVKAETLKVIVYFIFVYLL